ncbi:polyprenyl synthetase family protein [Streptomyces sp. NPDC056069]|uniref:polyprenyl synthetase family protein n=1 Tax=Streptomyces sp. NPDC056069 TaxID=3345702 RepID=UPI0035DC616D
MADNASLSAPALLEHSRARYTPALREAVGRLAAPMDTIAGYHFGWNDRYGCPTADDAGKAVRPALVLLSAQAAGGTDKIGIPGAVAVELVHNFSLLHDDIMDGDHTRRGRPTAWSVFGTAQAILVGDALLALAPQALLQATEGGSSPADTLRAIRQLTSSTCTLIEGQCQDLAFEKSDGISVAECLVMEGGKTGALLACACRIGAVLAGADDRISHALHRFGYHLGLAFQAVDDLLGIWGDPKLTGKARWGDLRRRKNSLPVCAALAGGSTASRRLSDLLTDPGSADDDEWQLAERATLIEAAGGRAYAEAEARRQHATALAALSEGHFSDRGEEQLTTLAAFLVNREK